MYLASEKVEIPKIWYHNRYLIDKNGNTVE